mgnify:CR=1 FL=1
MHRPPGWKPPEVRERIFDRERREASPHRLWYASTEWRQLRKARLQAEPDCRFCRNAGIAQPAEVVDHIVPHRGDRARFLDFANTQSLCKRCHDRDKQRIERRG